MDIPNTARLLQRIETFCERHQMSESRFGREVANDPALVSQMRGGREVRLSMVDRIAAFMARSDAEKEQAA